MNKRIKIITSFFLCFLTFPLYAQNMVDEFQSPLPEGKKWKLVWNDEFNSNNLDTTKWGFRLHIMQARHTTWTDDAYEMGGEGHLVMKVYEENGEYYTSQLQTGSNFMDRPGNQYENSKLTWPIANLRTPKFVHKYGYYEIRCKLPVQEGWWVAFWLQSPVIGASLDPVDSGVEIDIMENFTRDGVISHNIHWNGYGVNHKHAGSGPRKFQLNDGEFHTYGVDWSPEGYTFYVDGKESWKASGPVSHREQFIIVSAECNGYRNGSASPILKKVKLPDYFIVDYVRVFDEIR